MEPSAMVLSYPIYQGFVNAASIQILVTLTLPLVEMMVMTP